MPAFIIIGVVFALVLVFLIRANIQSYRQGQAMKIQSLQIEKQLHELEERNQALLQSNQEKLQLISLVSHDLKGPFNRIFALVQLLTLNPENLSPEQKEYLGKIQQVAADGLAMVRNLLDHRRLEDKGIELHPATFDLSSLISSLVKNYRTIAEKKDIQIIWLPPPPDMIHADRLYVSRIIENLISNAIKFSPEHKTVTVEINPSPDLVEISVADEGPGIGREEQPKLFQRFQRLKARPTGGESSTGLGLFIVKSIVEKMGGQVFCESEPPHGAKFFVRLPRT
ncbi:MAG: HAMP domain-containing histidine kinase [Bacteroidetes bacterium]|nr:HAMP domain-containing histidine kinase [Bacteroidota bacterium]MBS1540700.1 HAMP domain-containing histidine kinase [Bacteroidota bacterium]